MRVPSIFIADAQYLSRSGMRALIEEDGRFEVVGEGENVTSSLDSLKANEPSVVIIDYNSPGNFAIEDISRIRVLCPNSQIMVVTNDQNKQNIFQSLQYGVNSIITKNCSHSEILNAIEATTKSTKFFCNTILNIILEKHIPQEEENCDPSNLSSREVEIVKLVASGVKTKDLADMLNLSTHTIYTHRKNIMRKLGINSVSELILYAVNSGIVKPTANAAT